MYILSLSLNMLQFSNKTHTVLILIHVKSVSLTAKHFLVNCWDFCSPLMSKKLMVFSKYVTGLILTRISYATEDLILFPNTYSKEQIFSCTAGTFCN